MHKITVRLIALHATLANAAAKFSAAVRAFLINLHLKAIADYAKAKAAVVGYHADALAVLTDIHADAIVAADEAQRTADAAVAQYTAPAVAPVAVPQ